MWRKRLYNPEIISNRIHTHVRHVGTPEVILYIQFGSSWHQYFNHFVNYSFTYYFSSLHMWDTKEIHVKNILTQYSELVGFSLKCICSYKELWKLTTRPLPTWSMPLSPVNWLTCLPFYLSFTLCQSYLDFLWSSINHSASGFCKYSSCETFFSTSTLLSHF